MSSIKTMNIKKNKTANNEDIHEIFNENNELKDSSAAEGAFETFTWHKKLQKEGLSQINDEERRRQTIKKHKEMQIELEKVKQKKQERESFKNIQVEEYKKSRSHTEVVQRHLWEKQENNFHLSQVQNRSYLRILHQRAKPIDYLACFTNSVKPPLNIKIPEPETIISELSIEDYEDLIEDIRVYRELENGVNDEYWSDIVVLATDSISCKTKSNREFNLASAKLTAEMKDDVFKIFKNKTYDEMKVLKEQIVERLKVDQDIDADYWQSILRYLNSTMARTRLASIVASYNPNVVAKDTCNENFQPINNSKNLETTFHHIVMVPENDIILEQQKRNECLKTYKDGSYSPTLLQLNYAQWCPNLITPDEDRKIIERDRNFVIETKEKELKSKEAEGEFKSARQQIFQDEEDDFNETVPINQSQDWVEKYRPRKPRFLNKVHTGYEWNKYNQTHYDADNPPPKIVIGYKFNIFYPELLDRTRTPQYSVNVCKDDPDFALLIFSNAPPYEDIAFKIVSREWDYANRQVFKCQFSNNVFQLWFYFKKYRYRR